MLNKIWIFLILAGVLIAAGKDIADETRNTYRNGIPLTAAIAVGHPPSVLTPTWQGEMSIPSALFAAFYGVPESGDVKETVTITTAPSGVSVMTIPVNESSPPQWKLMAQRSGSRDHLTAAIDRIQWSGGASNGSVRFIVDPIRFVKLKAVTAAAIDWAAIAVNVVLGLVGVMALWLGLMRIAEEAGMLTLLTRFLRPVTRFLFPDIPADHPAIAAIIMNTAANMLGLSNAATPLGLKAMEELNKLNPRAGTATNAMVTFLAINTGGFVIIPATAIAVRAAAGSVNPGIIIGTSIVGAGCATVAGILASRLLQRLPMYRKEKEDRHD